MVRPHDLQGLTIAFRRYEDGELKLILAGGEELKLVCDCGRCHWLTTTVEIGGAMVLTLVCHNCRRRIELPYVESAP